MLFYMCWTEVFVFLGWEGILVKGGEGESVIPGWAGMSQVMMPSARQIE